MILLASKTAGGLFAKKMDIFINVCVKPLGDNKLLSSFMKDDRNADYTVYSVRWDTY